MSLTSAGSSNQFTVDLGTVHFLCGREGWWDLRGPGDAKKYGFKGGGGSRKIWCKGVITKKIAFKFGSDSIYNDANINARMPKNSFSKVLKIQNFPGVGMPPGTPYFIIHPTTTLPHQLLRYKIQPG